MWGDSDIPYLKQVTDPDRIKLSISRGTYFPKIGAKITETSQPLDLGTFFKILKKAGKIMASIGVDITLSILVGIIFGSSRKKKTLLSSTLKENALKNCISTSPEMIAVSFFKINLNSVIYIYRDDR